MAAAVNEKTGKVSGDLTPCQVTYRHRRVSSLYLPQTTRISPQTRILNLCFSLSSPFYSTTTSASPSDGKPSPSSSASRFIFVAVLVLMGCMGRVENREFSSPDFRELPQKVRHPFSFLVQDHASLLTKCWKSFGYTRTWWNAERHVFPVNLIT